MTTDVEDVIYEAKILLRLQDTSDHDSDMDIFINEALRHIDSIDTYEDCNYVFDVTSNTVKLPKGFKKWGALRFIELINSDDPTISPIVIPQPFVQTLYVDYQFLSSCEITTQELQQAGALPYTTVCKIRGNYIVFNSSITSVYAKGQLSYKGLAKDEDGRLLLKEDYTRALKAYICWRFGQIYPERYPRDIRDEWRAEWKAQKDWLRGLSAQENANRNRWVISNIMRKLKVNTV